MAFKIDDFTTALVGDGARPNLFQVSIPNMPVGISGSSQSLNSTTAPRALQFLAKSAQLPGSTLGTVPMYYFGREVKLAGNRTFADWTVTIVNDENFLIRNSIEQWMNYINGNQTNVRGTGQTAGSPQQIGSTSGYGPYTCDANVYQYSKFGNGTPTAQQDAGVGAIKAYRFVGMFPVDLSPIDLDWGSNDSVEEFTVTFAYQYWISNTTPTDTGTPLVVGQ
jgi:hypothetical protein